MSTFQADGERTGEYLFGGEELLLNDCGESVVSYADHAIAIIDEIESSDHARQRIGIVRKQRFSFRNGRDRNDSDAPISIESTTKR